MSIAQRFTSGVKISLEALRGLIRNPLLFVYMGAFVLFNYGVDKLLKTFGVLYSRFGVVGYFLKGVWGGVFLAGIAKIGLDLSKAVVVMFLAYHTIKIAGGQAKGIGSSIKGTLSKLRRFVPWGLIYFTLFFVAHFGTDVLHEFSLYKTTQAWLPINVSQWIFLGVDGLFVFLYIVFWYLIPIIVAVEDTTLNGAIVKVPRVIKKLFVEFFLVFAPIMLLLQILIVEIINASRNKLLLPWAAETIDFIWSIAFPTVLVVTIATLYQRLCKK